MLVNIRSSGFASVALMFNKPKLERNIEVEYLEFLPIVIKFQPFFYSEKKDGSVNFLSERNGRY